tara:strand:- start:235 stop:2832 length:2598 start_codon:yes stop_codon:yes gene_type:complete
MDYKLNVKNKSSAVFTTVDLLDGAIINFDLDFYDVDNIDKIKVPVNVDLALPKTNSNVQLFDYDPSSSLYNNVPTSPFDFELYVDNSKVLEGNLYVESYSYNNTIPTINIRLVDRIQEIFNSLENATFKSMYSEYDATFSFEYFLNAQRGVISTEPANEDILFPYVDFCNDTERFGYPQRQFIQFGPDSSKVGFIPAYKVSGFVTRFFSEVGVGVTSRFLELGSYGSSIPGHNPDDLYMLLNTKVLASSDTRQRGFYLIEGPEEYFVNEYTASVDYTDSSAKEKDTYPAQSLGWNYNPTPNANASDNGYGLSFRTNLPNDGTNVDRAYFGSHMNYTAKPYEFDLITGLSRALPSGSYIDLELPMIETSENSYSIVKNISVIQCTAKFGIVATLWKDGSPQETFRMMNTNNSVKEFEAVDAQKLDLSNETAKQFSVYDPIDPVSGSVFPHWENIYTGSVAPRKELFSRLRWSASYLGQFKWEDKEIEIESGSTYAVSMSFDWIEGFLICDYVDTWQNHPTNNLSILGYAIPDNVITQQVVSSDTLTKAVFKEDSSNVGELYLSLVSTGNHNPYFLDDGVNVNWSQEFSDVDPYETMKEILARFNLSVVYDQKTSSVLIDRLPDIRESNADQDITNKLDDREEIVVDIVSKIAKSITISTSLSGLFYDKYGYKKLDLNPAGSDDLTFSLNSRFYNKSLCGDVVVDEYDGGYLSDNEIGFTSNEFSKYTEIGITFGYISAPSYQSNIKRAKFIEKSFYKGIVYETLSTHVFPRFVKDKANSLSLYHFGETGVGTDLFTFFTGNDNVNYYSKPKVTFTALIDKNYAFDIKDSYSKVSLGYVNGNGIIIKSVKGQLFDSGIYSEVVGIIL